MAKRIEMNIKGSDSSYEVLWPEDGRYTDEQILSDPTRELLGIENGTTPDDAFAKLALGAGRYGYVITVTDQSGNALEGVTISGITTIAEGSVVTNAEGVGFGVSTNTNPSLTFIHNFWDLQNSYSRSVTSNGTMTYSTIQIPSLYSDNQLITIDSSTSLNLSPRTKNIDICCVGGGGEGQKGNTQYRGGDGGDGGSITNLYSQVLTSRSISISIGAGGSSSQSRGDNGETGGTTTVTYNNTITSAEGGPGGGLSTQGQGNGGRGGSAPSGNGRSTSVYIFDTSSYGTVSGGGGGASEERLEDPGTGAGNGGDGGPYSGTRGGEGTSPGGGGGGGSGTNSGYDQGNGGNGGDGKVYLRLHY